MKNKMHKKWTVKGALLVSAVLMTTACSDNMHTVSNGKKTWMVSTEKLLNMKASIFASNDKSFQTPEEMHAAARKRVKPDLIQAHPNYAMRMNRSNIFAASNFRLLALEPKQSGYAKQYDVALLSVEPNAGGIPAPASRPAYDRANQVIQVAKADIKEPAVEKEKVKTPRYTEDELAQTKPLTVVNMRMGDYEDKTRLVFDLNAAAKYEYDLNNLDSVLTVHIDGADWDLESQRYFDNHPLIQSYEIETGKNHDKTLHIALKKPSRMLMSGFVRPDASHGHRIFFDVAAL